MSFNIKINTAENSRFNWIAAIDSWDYCDPKPLGEMLNHHPLPEELQPIIADMITGTRKPKTKAVSSKLAPSERMAIANAYLSLRQIPEAILAKKTTPNYEEVADKQGLEVIDYLRQVQANQREYDHKMLQILGISERTLKTLVSEYKHKLKSYPKL